MNHIAKITGILSFLLRNPHSLGFSCTVDTRPPSATPTNWRERNYISEQEEKDA
jgi:hypothetical protein